MPPATLQLIWHGALRTPLYHVEIIRMPAGGSAQSVRTVVTTADTTWTQANLPAGELRIRVRESGDGYLSVTVPVRGDRPIACRP